MGRTIPKRARQNWKRSGLNLFCGASRPDHIKLAVRTQAGVSEVSRRTGAKREDASDADAEGKKEDESAPGIDGGGGGGGERKEPSPLPATSASFSSSQSLPSLRFPVAAAFEKASFAVLLGKRSATLDDDDDDEVEQGAEGDEDEEGAEGEEQADASDDDDDEGATTGTGTSAGGCAAEVANTSAIGVKLGKTNTLEALSLSSGATNEVLLLLQPTLLPLR